MFVVIVITCLVTIMSLIIASAFYLITLLSEESDDSEYADTLSMHTDNFSSLPIDQSSYRDIVCEDSSHHHQCSLDRKSSDTTEASAPNSATEDEGTKSPKDEPISGLAKETGPTISQVFGASSVKNATTKQSNQSTSWLSLTQAQKNTVATQLGVPAASRQMFEEFDQKEMALGGSGLHWCKTRKVLDRIVKLGVPLDVVNNNNETALHVAARKRKLPIIIGLLCYGAEVNCRNKKGETPLIIACKMNDIFATQLLLVFDADVNATDNLGFTARHYVADICDKHRVQTPLPSAAHLNLAMLNEMGALRCVDDGSAKLENSTCQHSAQNQSRTPASVVVKCTSGCSFSGSYNGNTYNRWPDFEKESLYKRHMFTDLIESLKQRKSLKNLNPRNQSIEGQNNDNDLCHSNILCIDGGGMRGIIVCQIMIEMEKYLKNPMISYFDWIGGTSVGAFLACALCNGTSLQQLRRISFDVKDEVFSGNKPYNSKFLERVLKRTLGTRTRMSAIKGKKLAVPTVIADRDPCQLRFFRNYPAVNTMLEKCGYPPRLFNNMSGHSIMVQKQSSNIETNKPALTTKIASKSSSSSSSSTVTYRAMNIVKTSSITNKTVSQTPTNEKSQIEQSNLQNSSKFLTNQQQPGDDESLDEDDDKATTTKGSINESTIDYVIDENDLDPYLWQAVRASGAAPFFFKPYGPYLDGGIISNNPTLDILTEFHTYEKAKRFLQARKVNVNMNEGSRLEFLKEKPCKANLVVSLGTGRGRVIGKQAMIDFGQVASGFSTVFSPVELIRSIRAARDLFKKLMQQSCHTEDYILDRAQAWCSSLDIPYFRINPPLTTIFSIDDKRDEQLINALWQTKLYMRQMSPQLEELREFLDGPQVEESQTIEQETEKNFLGSNLSDYGTQN